MAEDAARWFQCPIPVATPNDVVTLSQGEGGKLTRRLIRERILSRLGNPALRKLADSACLSLIGINSGNTSQPSQLAFTTDGYTVSPLFFPGGNIGRLAVFGTVNDLAVAGAIPHWLSLGMIIEEGFSLSILDQILESIQQASNSVGIEIVTGDTKVVPRGAADGIFLTTAGIGTLLPNAPQGPESIQPGDDVIVSGPIGAHGMAILCARERFEFDPPPQSDCASIAEPMLGLLRAGIRVRAARDATRGGVAAVLHEWLECTQTSCTLVEEQVPVSPPVRAVAELLGLDPLHLANEGTFVLATSPDQTPFALELLHQHEQTKQARVIGRIGPDRRVPLSIVRGFGREVPVDEPTGAPLPRIC